MLNEAMKSDSNNDILPRIEELSEEQENVLEQNIVWVFGSRRSGTTWLGKQLLSYNTCYIHEPTLIDHLAIPVSPGAKNLIGRMSIREEFENYFFSKKYSNTWKYYLRKLILYRILSETQDFTKKIIVKEPITLLDGSDIISKCLPNSKIIFLMRDGRDVIDSLIDARKEGGWLALRIKTVIKKNELQDFILHRAKMWVAQTKNFFKTYEKGSKENMFLVKYEDLRKNTFETISSIYKFLKIDISDNELKKIIDKYSFENIPENEKGSGKFNRSATPGKWKENFSKDEIEIMNNIMDETLKRLGYN